MSVHRRWLAHLVDRDTGATTDVFDLTHWSEDQITAWYRDLLKRDRLVTHRLEYPNPLTGVTDSGLGTHSSSTPNDPTQDTVPHPIGDSA
jgi:hypothetical protein